MLDAQPYCCRSLDVTECSSFQKSSAVKCGPWRGARANSYLCLWSQLRSMQMPPNVPSEDNKISAPKRFWSSWGRPLLLPHQSLLSRCCHIISGCKLSSCNHAIKNMFYLLSGGCLAAYMCLSTQKPIPIVSFIKDWGFQNIQIFPLQWNQCNILFVRFHFCFTALK